MANRDIPRSTTRRTITRSLVITVKFQLLYSYNFFLHCINRDMHFPVLQMCTTISYSLYDFMILLYFVHWPFKLIHTRAHTKTGSMSDNQQKASNIIFAGIWSNDPVITKPNQQSTQILTIYHFLFCALFLENDPSTMENNNSVCSRIWKDC